MYGGEDHHLYLNKLACAQIIRMFLLQLEIGSYTLPFEEFMDKHRKIFELFSKGWPTKGNIKMI